MEKSRELANRRLIHEELERVRVDLHRLDARS